MLVICFAIHTIIYATNFPDGCARVPAVDVRLSQVAGGEWERATRTIVVQFGVFSMIAA